ncbi:ROK family transcriptional regulator [Aureimonas ureilytica]|uniref:ROK family transcriptional regulator n=1 Tax=Aureimonas ureilytica TaxID=401562 RepID=A0A175RY63_9HYPH|nr:ROK family transcriptional regulator [Aureimonas ureilytica]KTR08258.1 ROK family transcriptional regulator [Aureimonas ureilytica]
MKTGDPELMREINRFHILDLIRRHGPISRVELCARGELSSTTVSAITGALIEDGIIQPVAVGGIHEPTRGRPRVMLQLNPVAARVVGLRVGPHGIAVTVTDFRGEILASLELPVRVRRQSVPVVADLAEDAVRRAVVEAGLTLKSIDSVCATVPGIVEYGTGLVRLSPIFSEPDVVFGEALSSRLGVPAIVESDANALALAEHWFGSCRDMSDFAVVSLEQAIGLGVLHGGQLFRGVHGLSHDIGSMVIGRQADGRLLRLIDLASEQAVLCGFEADPSMRDAVHAGLGLRHAVERLSSDGVDVASVRDVVEQAGHAIGIAVANIVTLFAPPRIVLSGALLHLGAALTDAIAQGFAEAVAEPLARSTTMSFDPPRASARLGQGAAAVALCELYGSPWNTTGPVRPAA